MQFMSDLHPKRTSDVLWFKFDGKGPQTSRRLTRAKLALADGGSQCGFRLSDETAPRLWLILMAETVVWLGLDGNGSGQVAKDRVTVHIW